MAEEIDVAVVIVGGGPIGLTLSCILGKNDIKHVLLEKNEATTKWPKAMLANTRSMELYRRLGLDTAIYEEEVPGGDQVISCRSLINEEPMVKMQVRPSMFGENPHLNADGTYTYDEQWTPATACRISQVYLEPILKREAGKFASSEIKFGWEVKSISQTQENVVIGAVNTRSGEQKVYKAQYAVGCDGGKSFVRRSLGIHYEGDYHVGDMKSVSFYSKGLHEKLVADDIFGAVTLKPNLVTFTLPLNNEGLFVSHSIITSDKDMDHEKIVKTLMDDEDLPYTTVFANDWKGHFVSAQTLQEGRIFLAGDACHLMVPVGGFGMNTGILDAYDLGWKLVATIKGWGGEKLLASYTVERLPSIHKVLRRVKPMFRILQRYWGILSFLFGTRPFKNILKMIIDTANMNLGMSGILFGLHLETSPLCIPSSTPLPPEDLFQYTPSAYPGCRAPHFLLEDGTSLYDKLGSAFTLLHLLPSNQNYDSVLSAAAHFGIPLKAKYGQVIVNKAYHNKTYAPGYFAYQEKVLSFNDRKLKRLYRGMDFVLIRPDLYIAWCGKEIPTLLHNEDVNEGAKVLMKVVTGGANLPAEWQHSRKNRRTIRVGWLVYLVVGISLVVGVSTVIWGQYM